MSGIAGIIHFDGRPADPGLIAAMTASMAHRGPDGIRHWVQGGVALGQCMLRTTPESLQEQQPLANEDASLVLVMDGRVDNWEELRRELLGRGAVLRDRSDAELALRAYEAWGRECLAHIEGDFALAIWDGRRRELFCARDRMGHKPFHYHWDGTTLSFASEVKAILALPWVRQEPNEGMLAEFLSWQWRSNDETLWNGILRLMAAHRMAPAGGPPRPEPYWKPDLWSEPPFRGEPECAEYYRELLADLVKRLSRSHRPVSMDVSGGLDSSALFCIAEGLRRAGSLPAPGIAGYTFAFAEEDGDAYELPYARAVGEHLGIPLNEIPPFRAPPSWFVQTARSDRDFPGFPNGAMCMSIYQRAAQGGSRVHINGVGGDQWMQGSPAYYAEELVGGQWSNLAQSFKADAEAFGTRQAATWLLRYGFFLLLPPSLQGALRQMVRAVRGRESLDWLSPRMQAAVRLRTAKARPRNRPIRSAGQAELLETLDHPYRTHAAECSERLASHCGIELRYPLDAPQIVQFALSTPARFWHRGDTIKHLHVQGLQGVVPSIILARKDKADFIVLLYKHLDTMREALVENLPKERQAWVRQEGIERLFQACQGGVKANRWIWILWTLYGCDAVFRESAQFFDLKPQ